jgi:drug/metabolite transporter (DMT)-like permease
MQNPNSHIKHYLELHFIVFIWGFTAILGKLIQLDALALVWYRIGLSLPVLALWMLWNKISFEVTGRQLLKYLFGGVMITLHWISFFMAIKVSNVSLTLVVLSSGAFFAALLEPIFFKRRIRGRELIMGVMISLGIYLIFRVSHFHLAGFLWAITAAITSALFSVSNGLFVYDYEGSKLSFYQLFIGFIALTVFIWVSDLYVSPDIISGSDWIYLLILSVICTAYPFAKSISLMRYISPYTVMLTVNMEPVYGILLALMIFGEEERMHPMFYVGSLLILGIVLWNGKMKMKEEQQAKSQ